jgi:CubicO group peptidase (beta-lactamase class C family)
MSRFVIRRWSLALALLLAGPVFGADRVPGERWLRYADPAEAGFDTAKLEAARATWEGLPSSAFFVVADGAVVAAWGEVDRRFMCHSVRKSFLSALYGAYWDQGRIELNKTLADLGIDDTPDPLLATERQARILDLLKARSGVFHPAAYAGRTDSRPRGSEGPGRYFAYNNWDFNTLATILEEETGEGVFEAFDTHFARPLQMQDWRVSDGYYHFERDKSRFPAYPFRMSARDAARFGLLFAREGAWGDTRILSRHWVRRSAALYSIDSDVWGYGFMWWVAREPRFEEHGLFAALGVGNQMIAALPESDLVIVNRANTYRGEGTPSKELLDLVEQVLEARTLTPVADPFLVPLEDGPSGGWVTDVEPARLDELVGTWTVPAPPLGLPAEGTVTVRQVDGHLVGAWPEAGTFALYLQPDGTLRQEDSRDRYIVVTNEKGAPAGLADVDTILLAALAAAGSNRNAEARAVLEWAGEEDAVPIVAVRVVVDLLGDASGEAEDAARDLAARAPAQELERAFNRAGYTLMSLDRVEPARAVFELNATLFPEAFNTWDSLAEACARLDRIDDAVRFYERSLALNPENQSARRALEELRTPAREEQ